MEDGNYANAKDDKIVTASLGNYCEESANFTANGHGLEAEAPSPLVEQQSLQTDSSVEDKFKKRVNPLKIHLGKRPFVDNSVHNNNTNKRKTPSINRNCEPSLPHNNYPRAPRLIPKKKVNRNQLHNVSSSQSQCFLPEDEQDKPVPRLVPKSQILQFKKSASEKTTQVNDYPQNTGIQPMVKFKCRKCCSMSFKTLAMLKEHQLVCRAQAKEPAHSPEAAPSVETNNGGPPRVTRKVYLCSACGTYYENWNLFLHMREVHNRHICLFCLGMFSKAEKLSAHLVNKHSVKEYTYDSKEDFFEVYNGTLYLMCCECDEICSEQDDFFNHDCNNVKPKPVPVLVSKNASKINLKSKNGESSIGPSNVKEAKPVCESSKADKIKSDTPKPEMPSFSSTLPIQVNDSVSSNSLSTATSDVSSNKISDSIINDAVRNEVNYSDKHFPSATFSVEPDESNNLVTNGVDNTDFSRRNYIPMDIDNSAHTLTNHYEINQPIEKESCGIKLKLSLNKANSPVIINSTVDPTVGQQSLQKPPSRARRPPKRYEKDIVSKSSQPPSPVLPKTPSIKMTICDKADSPFVKTTFYENNQETTMKTLLNNNFEMPVTSTPKTMENTVLSTIYDNKLEESNTLNRVPKLTVRVPKELLDKDSSSDYSSDSDVSDKLTVDENKPIEKVHTGPIEEPVQIKDELDRTLQEADLEPEPEIDHPKEEFKSEEKFHTPETSPVLTKSADVNEVVDTKTEPMETQIDVEKIPEEAATDEIPVVELKLNRPLDKYPLKELLRVLLLQTVNSCIYCNHVRKIATNCEQLALHMASEHRFSATVDSITAEELMPETITTKIQFEAVELKSVFMNLDSYDSEQKMELVESDNMFECFQCYYKTPIHKGLYLHNRKMHQKTILLCVMCKSNFYSYSELLCHLCPGTYDSECEIKYRCSLCNVDTIPSSFRLMVHLRKVHNACDVCLESCHNQSKLSNHVWKHKLHHLCYRCGIAYRNKPDITKHLFWKHGTESVLCKRCLQKKWPHVYHFCTPPALFICEECNLQFTKAVYLKVHKRFHLEEYPHVCSEEGCIDKFVSKKLLMKHLEEHQRKLAMVDLDEKDIKTENKSDETKKDEIPVIDLVDDPCKEKSIEKKPDGQTEPLSKKSRKKKQKEKDALLLDVNLPELNLSESDSSDESDSGISQTTKDEKVPLATVESKAEQEEVIKEKENDIIEENKQLEVTAAKTEETDQPEDEQKILEIWDNFKKFQAKTEKKEKSPPLVPIRKHVCESDHDYCLVPTEYNGDHNSLNSDKKKNKKKDKRFGDMSSSSSSSSSDSDSSCSCGSNCSCSSSSGSSSSSSSDSDSSNDLNSSPMKKKKQRTKTLSNRRLSNGSNVDVMGMSETPVLVPEKTEPPVAETDLDTEESETDEEFYDEHPQKLANKLYAEKRNQLMLLASVASSDGCLVPGEVSRPPSPNRVLENSIQVNEDDTEKKEKTSSSKKKSKKKKKSKSSRRHEPIKINIPKDIISKTDATSALPRTPSLFSNKITISLQKNTVQIPEISPSIPNTSHVSTPLAPSAENKRASKRRRVPNKFYGYSSDEESNSTTPQHLALKPQQPPKLEWRKEDLPSPVTHKAKKEVPSTVVPPRLYNYNYTEPIRLTAPIPDPEPPRILMNSESMESSDSDSSEEGALEIYQPSLMQKPAPAPPPTYLNSGTSSLPYAFQRPAGRQAREGESVYCYCRCPYDEVSEMIACDADGCNIEWFHFECVGIMVPPKGKWYCPECRKKQSFSGYR